MSSYGNKKVLKDPTGVETSPLTLKIFSSFKTEVKKLDIGKLLNVPGVLNSLKKKGDDLDTEK